MMQWVGGCRRTAMALLLACTSGLAAPHPTRADYATPRLGALVVGSSTVALGVVTQVDAGQAGSSFTLQIAFDEILAGSGRSSWAVSAADSSSDGVPRLPVGTPILAFVPANNGIPREPNIIPLTGANKPEVRVLVQTVVQKGNSLTLADVRPRMAVTDPSVAVPLSLRGMLLEELTLRLTPVDETGVVEMACTDGGFWTAARKWAVGRVGARQIANGRTCLEALLVPGSNRELAIAAAEALGDLRSPESLAPLLGALATKKRDPKIRPRDASKDVLTDTGPSSDRESEVSTSPDPGEAGGPSTDNPDGSPAGSGGAASDPETRTEVGKGPDARRRFSDSGLTNAAILAIGKIGSASAVAPLLRIAKEGDSLPVHSTVVNALGLIQDKRSTSALEWIAAKHPNPLVRAQATEALARR